MDYPFNLLLKNDFNNKNINENEYLVIKNLIQLIKSNIALYFFSILFRNADNTFCCKIDYNVY